MLGSPIINPIGTVDVGDSVKVSDLFFLPGWGAYISNIATSIPSESSSLKEFILNNCNKVVPAILPNNFEIDNTKLISSDDRIVPGRNLSITVVNPHPSPVDEEVMVSCEFIYDGNIIGTSSEIGTAGTYNINIDDTFFNENDYETTVDVTIVYYDNYGNSFKTNREYLVKEPVADGTYVPLDIYDIHYMNPRVDEHGILYIDNHVPYLYDQYVEQYKDIYHEFLGINFVYTRYKIEKANEPGGNIQYPQVVCKQSANEILDPETETLVFNPLMMFNEDYTGYSEGAKVIGYARFTISFIIKSLPTSTAPSTRTRYYDDNDVFGYNYTDPTGLYTGKVLYNSQQSGYTVTNKFIQSDVRHADLSIENLQGFYKAAVAGDTKTRFAIEIGDLNSGTDDLNAKPHNLYISIVKPEYANELSINPNKAFSLDTSIDVSKYFSPSHLLKANTPGYYDIYPTITQSPITRFQGSWSHWGEYLPTVTDEYGSCLVVGSYDFYEQTSYAGHTPQYDPNGALFLYNIDRDNQTVLNEVIYEYSDLPQTVRDQVEECYDHMVSTDGRAEYIRNAKFGCDVSLSNNGKVLAVGMPQSPTANTGSSSNISNYQINGKGAVILFDVDWETDPTNPLTVKKVLLPTNDHAFGFGHKLRLTPCGQHLVIECTDFNTTQSRGVTEYKGTTIDRDSNRQVYYYNVKFDRLHETIIPNGDTRYRTSIFATILSYYPMKADINDPLNTGYDFDKATIVFATDGTYPNTKTYQNGEYIHNNYTNYTASSSKPPSTIKTSLSIPGINYNPSSSMTNTYGIGRLYGRNENLVMYKHDLQYSSAQARVIGTNLLSGTNYVSYYIGGRPSGVLHINSIEHLIMPNMNRVQIDYITF